MSRSRPTKFGFVAHDDPELVAQMSMVQAGGSGWINIEPVIDAEHQPPEPGPFAFFGGSTHKVPMITWMPGHVPTGRSPKPTTIGLQHATGPRLASRLRDLGHPLATGWKVTQDHPRRGLVAEVPADADNRTVIDWLLNSATVVCQVEMTGRWEAAVHAGLS
ncbi:MAG: hypothetical protein WCI26_04515 [Acidimicrobiales bacterium]